MNFVYVDCIKKFEPTFRQNYSGYIHLLKYPEACASDISERKSHRDQRSFPVVDRNHRLCGIFSVICLLFNPQSLLDIRRKIIWSFCKKKIVLKSGDLGRSWAEFSKKTTISFFQIKWTLYMWIASRSLNPHVGKIIVDIYTF